MMTGKGISAKGQNRLYEGNEQQKGGEERRGKGENPLCLMLVSHPGSKCWWKKPCEMTLEASCNVISAMCEYEISNGFEHIRAVFICSIYSPLVSNAIC